MPTQTQCPICAGNRLLIVPDYTIGGQWHYCRDCTSSGDLIQLTSRALKLSIDAAISKLLEEGCIPLPPKLTPQDAVLKYKKHLTRFEPIHGLVERGAQFLGRSRTLAGLLNKLYINPHITAERTAKGFGKVVGGLGALDIEETFFPRNVILNHPGSKVKTCQTDERIFKMGHWGDVLMVPYYALPGRLARYQFIGRETRPDIDTPVKAVKAHLREREDGGLTFHEKLLKRSPGTIIAIEDLLIYLRMQASHYSRSASVLPLVSWFDNGKLRTRHAWLIFDKCKIVFWGWDLTPGILSQAYWTNGHISITELEDTTRGGIGRFIQRSHPETHLKAFERSAKPWPEAFELWAKGSSDSALEDILRCVELKGVKLEKLLSHCSKALRKRCNRLVGTAPAYREILVNGKSLMDDEQGWRIRVGTRNHNWQLINEARLRIDKALRNPVDGNIYYQGRILFAGKELPFCETRDKIEYDAFTWMHDLLVDAEIGVPSSDPGWTHKAVSIALQISPAEIADGLSQVGWNEAKGYFDLPDYVLDRSGRVLCQDKALLFCDSPAMGLPKPEGLTPIELAPIVAKSEANRALLAGLIMCISRIIAPIYGYPTGGTALSSDSAAVPVRAAIDACGCNYYPLTTKSFEEARKREYVHSWPIGVGLSDRAQKILLKDWTNLSGVRNSFIRANWWQARVLLLHGWNVLEVEAADNLHPDVFNNVAKILPNYLKDLLERQFKLEAEPADIVSMVREDLLHWLARCHAPTENDLSGIFKAGQDNNECAIAELMASMVIEGRTQIVPAGFADEGNFVRGEHGLFIPKQLFLSFVDQRTSLDLSGTVITERLGKSGRLILDSELGWTVEEAWLAEQLRSLRK